MTGKMSLGKQAAAYSLGGAFQLLATLLLLPLVTLVLDKKQFGLVVTLQLITQLSVHIGSAGLPLATTREYFGTSDGPAISKTLVAASVPVSLIAVIFVSVTASVWTLAFDSVRVGSALWLAIAATVPRSLTASVLGYLRARQTVAPFLAVSAINTVGAQIAGIVTAALMGPTAAHYIAGYLGGSVVAGAFGWMSCHYPMSLPTRSTVRKVAKYALPAVPHAVATLVLQAGDKIVIESKLGLESVGRYQVAYLLATLAVPAVVAFNNAWSPRLAAADESGDFLNALVGPANALMVLVPTFGAISAILAPTAIEFGLPASYEANDLRTVIALASTSALGFTIFVVASQVLVVRRFTAPLAVVTPLAAAMNIALNIWLVPTRGLEAAAFTTSLTYLFMAIVPTLMARRLVRYRLSTRSTVAGFCVTLYGGLTMIIGVDGASNTVVRLALCLPLLALAAKSLNQLLRRPTSDISDRVALGPA